MTLGIILIMSFRNWKYKIESWTMEDLSGFNLHKFRLTEKALVPQTPAGRKIKYFPHLCKSQLLKLEGNISYVPDTCIPNEP